MKVKVQKSTTHGIGVFATKDIKKGDVVEVCPMMLFPEKEKKLLDKTTLKDYYFNYENGAAVMLGYGSIYNHSSKANVEVIMKDEAFANYVAYKNIKKGEELFINYNGNPNSKKKPFYEK
mgnify:FL=1